MEDKNKINDKTVISCWGSSSDSIMSLMQKIKKESDAILGLYGQNLP